MSAIEEEKTVDVSTGAAAVAVAPSAAPEISVEETEDPAVNIVEESLLDEDAKDGNDKDHDGWRSKMLRSRTLMEVAIVLLFITIIGVIIGITASKSETISSFAEITGHEFILSAQILVHPEYAGELDPSGTVSVSFDYENQFLLTTKVSGLEETCRLCSIRVYSQTHCFGVTGPPFWNQEIVHNNPWDHVHYNAHDGMTHSAVATYSGHSLEEMEGHAVVLDNSLGQQIGCGILEKDNYPRRVHTLYADVSNLPVYAMSQIGGLAKVQFFDDDTFIFQFVAEGLPQLCSRCQISIQEGTSCEEALIGSHYFDHQELERDPWVVARGAYYVSDVQGFGQRSFFLYNGHGFAENEGHAVLLKASDGTRIGCGTLGTKPIVPSLGESAFQ